MTLTTDPNDSRLTRGVDDKPVSQNSVYLVLSEEERAKGFVRPLRTSYIHVGLAGPTYPLRELTAEEINEYSKFGYVRYEAYTEKEAPVVGKYWSQNQMDNIGKGCHIVTKMARELAETYARNPHFYGSTYCVGCRKHLPVAEFTWVGSDDVVGS